MTAYLIPEYESLIIGGCRVGTWRRTITGKKATLETNLIAPLNRAQAKALRAAADRYADFLGVPLTLV